MSVFVPLNAGYTVSARRTSLNVLVLLTLAFSRGVIDLLLRYGLERPESIRI